ncbi:MAG TPA: L-threonylcarbamoyladenylate synthase [Bacillales bacterium]|nr:L-threonylcarbamoyladenylate synthase [Bacillales bacterium]
MNCKQTKVWTVDNQVNRRMLDEAAELLKRNEVVAFPTETVYGLGGNARSDEAVRKIFAAKGRPSDNPLIVHISALPQLNDVAGTVSEPAKRLMEAFWPGPLTLVLPKGRGVSELVTAGLSTVAVRMPNHPAALALIESARLPIAAPSANRSGRPSPTNAAHVKLDLDGKIAGIVDGGETGIGLESTVVDCSGDDVVILRPGGVTRREIAAALGARARVVSAVAAKDGEAPKSPGMKYRHYAPHAELTLVDGPLAALQEQVDRARRTGKKVGVMTTYEHERFFDADVVLPCGTSSDLSTVARGLYRTLREFDMHDVDVIYSEVFPETGVGEAIMNRLNKSAAGRIRKR